MKNREMLAEDSEETGICSNCSSFSWQRNFKSCIICNTQGCRSCLTKCSKCDDIVCYNCLAVLQNGDLECVGCLREEHICEVCGYGESVIRTETGRYHIQLNICVKCALADLEIEVEKVKAVGS